MSETKPTICDDEKITSEMLDAGLKELLEYDPNWGAKAREIAAEIYRAMRRVRTVRPNPSGEPPASEAGPGA